MVEKFIRKIRDLERKVRDINRGISNLKRSFNSIGNQITNEINKITRSLSAIPNRLNGIMNNIKGGLEKALMAMEKSIMVPLKGIDVMIQDFNRIICMFNTFPNRIDNIFAGVDSIFIGIGEQLGLYGKAAGIVFKETSTLVDRSFLLLDTYLQCGLKFLVNFPKCIIFYLLDIIGKLLYLPIILVLWISKFFLGIDLYYIEKDIWKAIENGNAFFFSIFGFHLIHFPKSIREDCYVCIRLRKAVVNRQRKVLIDTVNNKVPDIIDGRDEKQAMYNIEKGQRHFNEVSALPRAQKPNNVI